jgi:hypothetical protein
MSVLSFLMCEDLLSPTISATRVEESGTLLQGDEVRDISCENNYVLDFIAEPLKDPNPYYIIFQL